MAEIRAYAAGYADAAPLTLVVDETLRDRAIDIPMHKSGAVVPLQINLADGQPASGAELAAWSPSGEILGLATADELGRVSTPADLAGRRLVVRHPAAASLVVLFGPDQPTTMSLAPAAPPLVVRVVHADQRPIGTASAAMTYWCASVRLVGAIAAFATWSTTGTSGDGIWVGKGLPREPVRLLFARSVDPEQIASGSLDGLSQVIAWPWPAVASVTLANE
jgi:hypothetical protein